MNYLEQNSSGISKLVSLVNFMYIPKFNSPLQIMNNGQSPLVCCEELDIVSEVAVPFLCNDMTTKLWQDPAQRPEKKLPPSIKTQSLYFLPISRAGLLGL